MATQEKLLELPLDVIEASCGFSLDIGGSIAKIVYRSKKDFKNGKMLPGEVGNQKAREGFGFLRLKTISRTSEKVDEIVDYLLENCDFTTRDGVKYCCCTGVGSNLFADTLRDRLGIKMKNLMEMNCFINGHKFLCQKLNAEDLLIAQDSKVLFEAKHQLSSWEHWVKDVSDFYEGKERSNEEPQNAEKLKFPCVLMMCGSGAVAMEVHEDGRYITTEGTLFAGRYFLGISSLLTNGKNVEEVLKLAGKADGSTGDESEPNEKIPGNVYVMGKAFDNEVGEAEVVSSLLRVICDSLAEVAVQMAVIRQMSTVYFCGNFVDNDTARRLITESASQRIHLLPKGRQVDYAFLKYGGFLGAIGAFLHGTELDDLEDYK